MIAALRQLMSGQEIDEGILWPELGTEIFTQHNLRRALEQLPDERMPLDVRRAEVRLVTLDVVDNAIAGFGGRSVGVLGETKDQWNVWPPSITIVWPVTKSEPGPQK